MKVDLKVVGKTVFNFVDYAIRTAVSIYIIYLLEHILSAVNFIAYKMSVL